MARQANVYTDVQLSNCKKRIRLITLNFCTVFFKVFLWHCFEKTKRKPADQLKSCLPDNIHKKFGEAPFTQEYKAHMTKDET